MSANLKIKEIDNGRFFLTDEFLKNKFNYSLLFGPKYLEEKKTHMILMESSNPFLYQKYINKIVLNLDNILYKSQIFFLLSDFKYSFSYNKKVNKILLNI